MSCEHAREALSARLDAEAEGVPGDRVDRHVAGCTDCRGWSADVERLHRRIRVRPAATVPDLTARILAAADRTVIRPRPATSRAFPFRRWLLAGVAAAQFALIVVDQLGAQHLSQPAAADGHLLHEGTAWNAALGIGFAAAAARPRLAAGLLPTLTAFVAVLGTFAVVDLAHGRADVLREGSHLLVVAGWVLLWLLVRDHHPRPVRTGTGAPASRVDLDDVLDETSGDHRPTPRDRRRDRPTGRRAA